MSDETLLRNALRDEDRLMALRRTGLLDTSPEETFDRLTRMVCRLLGVPAALVSLVEADRQFFKSAVGLPQPWLLRRETSLLHSFCQHVVVAGEPLLVQDAGHHPLLSGNLAVAELGVIAYLGMPLITADGHVLGALCAIHNEPRVWTSGDAAALRDLAAVTMSEMTLRRLAVEMAERVRREAVEHEATEARLRRLEALRRLADDVGHDLAGVMQAVQSGVRLAGARLGHDPATAQSILGLVNDVARRGGVLAQRLTAFAPRAELRPEAVEVAPLLQRLARVIKSGPDVPLHVEVDVAPGLPPVLADPGELKSVLLGLVAAARDAMSDGGTLTLGAALEEIIATAEHQAALRPGRHVRLSIADTGTGLGGGASLPGALDPGAEFELAFARTFAEQVGGGLVREGRPGVGTTVTLWLPATETCGVAGAGPCEG
jgi:signal transduction histidine kinase